MTIEDEIRDYDERNPIRGNIDVVPQTRKDYIMSRYPQVEYKKYSFFTVLVMGIAAIGVGFMVSLTVMIIYGLNTLGNRPEEFVSLMEDTIRSIPIIRQSISPALSDVLNDRRRPDYRAQLEVTVQTQPRQKTGERWRTVITIVNNGTEIVSLLPFRVTILDSSGKIVSESSEFAATPMAIEPYWRGPLKPGSTRHFNCFVSGTSKTALTSNLTAELEVADIRIWDGAEQIWQSDRAICRDLK